MTELRRRREGSKGEGGVREERKLVARKRERERGENIGLPLLTHIEQRLQHQSAIAPASRRDPRSATQPPLQPELHCAASLGNSDNPASATPCQRCNDITCQAQVINATTAAVDGKAGVHWLPRYHTTTHRRSEQTTATTGEGVFALLT